MNPRIYRCAGTTLIELMISIIIVGILVIGFSQIYLNVKDSYRFQQTVVQAQENGRFAAYFLRQQIRGAGFFGCRRFYTDLSLTFSPLVIYKANGASWDPLLPAQIQGKVKTGSDVIQISGLGPSLSSLLEPMQDQTKLIVSKEQAFQVGDTVMIGDCLHADLFSIAKVIVGQDSQILISDSVLNFRYGRFATIAKHRSDIYYIRKVPWTNRSGDVIHGLYRMESNSYHSELIPGVEAMHALMRPSQDGETHTLVSLRLLIATLERVGTGAVNQSLVRMPDKVVDNRLSWYWDIHVSLR